MSFDTLYSGNRKLVSGMLTFLILIVPRTAAQNYRNVLMKNKNKMKEYFSLGTSFQNKVDKPLSVHHKYPQFNQTSIFTRNRRMNNKSRAGKAMNNSQKYGKKMSMMEGNKTLDSISCTACAKTLNGQLKTNTKGTMTNKSYFKSTAEKDADFAINLKNIEKWLDQKELNLHNQFESSHSRRISLEYSHRESQFQTSGIEEFNKSVGDNQYKTISVIVDC